MKVESPMWLEGIEYRHVREMRGADGGGMERGDVVSLAIGVERALPVRCRGEHAGSHREGRREIEQRDIVGEGSQMRGRIEGSVTGRRRDEDQAIPLRGWHLQKIALIEIEAFEA